MAKRSWKKYWTRRSLDDALKKNILNTLLKNQIFLKNRWSLPERLVIGGAKHLLIAILLLPLIAVIGFILIISIQLIFPVTSNNFNPIIAFQTAIFSAQVTLLGLIFPLVIAFIGILLQEKLSNDARWTIYRHHSGFMLVGASALTLSLCVVVLKLCEPWFPYQFKVATSISITGWFIINLILLLVGTFMDITPAVLIFTPIFLPVALQLGMDPTHFGILMIANLSIGLCTPPVGTCLFVGCSVGNARIAGVSRQMVPFYFAMIFVLLLITFIPQISLWLPSLFN